MKLRTSFATIAVLSLAASAPAHAQEPRAPAPSAARGGDDLEPSAPATGPSSPSLDLGAGRRIPIGAYGEINLTHQGDETEATVRRFVLFVGHSFTAWARFYSELEIEDGHEVEMEQAFLEFGTSRRFGARAGLVLLPIGIVNQLHEPPTYNGVERPLTDQVIIPTTWREIGAGIFGDVLDGVGYQLYVVNGLDASKFSPTLGIAPGRGQGAESKAENPAVTGRLTYERLGGLIVGGSFYFGGAAQRERSLAGTKVAMVEADARYRRGGLELRAEYARAFVTQADRITALQRDIDPAAAVVPSSIQGFYGEAGYDVLRLLADTEQQLVPFARYENVDLRAGMPSVAGAAGSNAQQFVTAGLTYRPHPQLVVKADYRRRIAGQEGDPDSGSTNPHRVSLGIGFMY